MTGRILARAAAAVALCCAAAACSDHDFHPPEEEERVAEARERYERVRFDTLTWESDQVRIEAGNLVYADECRRCHGVVGQGDTEYARRNDLEVPSLVEAEWELDGDVEGVRRSIFVGHEGGMPNWGVGKLTPRQIDAVAFYLVEQLRPEVLERGAPPVP